MRQVVTPRIWSVSYTHLDVYKRQNMEEDEISARIIKNKIGKENYKIFEQISNAKLQGGVMMEMPYQVKFQ